MLAALASLLAQSSAPADATDSNPAVLVVGVLLVTIVVVIVVIRRSKR